MHYMLILVSWLAFAQVNDHTPVELAPDPVSTSTCEHYEFFNGPFVQRSCEPSPYEGGPGLPTLNQVSDGATYVFSMYNVDSGGLNTVTGEGTLLGHFMAEQYINIADSVATNTADIVLYSYEPVRWVFQGNTAGIRSVHIRGHHCAQFTGVDASRVSIFNFENGASLLAGELPISTNIAKVDSHHSGTCIPNRTFEVD